MDPPSSTPQPDTSPAAAELIPQAPRPLWLVDQLILPLLMPIAVIRGQWRTASLGKAYLAHLYGMVVLLFGLAVYDVASALLNGYGYYGYSSSLILSLLEGNSYAGANLLTFLVELVLVSELSYFFTAFATMCWGAAPEPWRRSYARSLKRWWQLTPWHALITLLVMAAFTAIEYLVYYNDDYLPQLLLGSVLTISSLLFLFTTLRGLAVYETPGGWSASCKWPMTCEGCGYALAGQTLDQNCPECGRPVAHNAEYARGRLLSILPLNALMLGATQPSRIGQWMLVHRPMTGAGQVLARTVALMILSAPFGILITFAIIFTLTGEGFDELGLEMLLIWFAIFLFTAGSLALSMVMLGLFGASVVGTFYRAYHKRRAMHVAGQAAGYLSGVLLLWLMGNWVGFGLLAAGFSMSFMSTAPGWFDVLPLFWLVYNVGFGLVYLFMIGRVLKATRWANV